MNQKLSGLGGSPKSPGHITHKKSMRNVSTWSINVIAQVRKTFEKTETEELSDSIEAKGVINAPTVALFTRDELEQYLLIINRLWRTNHTVASLKPSRVKGSQLWYVLVAGERRTRAHRLLVRAGKASRFIQVVVHEHITPFDAIDIQFSENSHLRPPPHEEAHGYAEYWVLKEVLGTTVSLAQFARDVGRSASTIKNALRFVALPEVIRNAVAGIWGPKVPEAKLLTQRRLKLAYGITVDLARLAKIGVGEQELIDRMVGAVVSNTKATEFRAQVNNQIANQGQDMLNLLSVAAEEDTRRIFRRRTVEAGASRTLAGEEVWLAKVLALFEAGLLGEEDSPFALGSVRDRLIRIAELYERIHDRVYSKPSEPARKRREIVRRVHVVLVEQAACLPFDKAANS